MNQIPLDWGVLSATFLKVDSIDSIFGLAGFLLPIACVIPASLFVALGVGTATW